MEIRNIEIKARCADLEAARRVCERLGTRFDAIEEQEDIFYAIPGARLKLRHSSSKGAMLIYYTRYDTTEMKSSNGIRTPVPDPAGLHAILSAVLPVRGTVRKTRAVHWLDNIKIHLDQVEGVGTFLEFELVMAPDEDVAAGRRKMADMIEEFGVCPEDLVAEAYIDVIEATKQQAGR